MISSLQKINRRCNYKDPYKLSLKVSKVGKFKVWGKHLMPYISDSEGAFLFSSLKVVMKLEQWLQSFASEYTLLFLKIDLQLSEDNLVIQLNWFI